MKIRLRGKGKAEIAAVVPAGETGRVPVGRPGSGLRVGHRQFLKMLAGAAGLAGAVQLAAPRAAQATYTAGPPDVVNTDLTVQGNLTVDGGETIGALATPKRLDVAGTVRATATLLPTSGVGVEVCYLDGQGYVVSYDRTASAHKPLHLSGSELTLNVLSGTGNVGIAIWHPEAKLHLGSGSFKIGSKVIADSGGSYYA